MLYLLAFGIFGVALFGMAVGVIFSDRRIRGSCGGLSNLGGKQGKVACDACPSGGKGCQNHDEQHQREEYVA